MGKKHAFIAIISTTMTGNHNSIQCPKQSPDCIIAYFSFVSPLLYNIIFWIMIFLVFIYFCFFLSAIKAIPIKFIQFFLFGFKFKGILKGNSKEVYYCMKESEGNSIWIEINFDVKGSEFFSFSPHFYLFSVLYSVDSHHWLKCVFI